MTATANATATKPELSDAPYVILGCGYVGTRLAQSLLADGIRVRVCARRVALLEPLRELGADVHYMDGGRPHQFGPALLGLDRPIVVYSIPGVPDLPQGEAVRRAAGAAHKVHARSFVYLGSSAVYGRSESVTTADWVDEDTVVATNDPEAGMRLSDEAAVQSIAQAGQHVVTLRLGAIYGPPIRLGEGVPGLPGRGVRQRLRSGEYKLWDNGRYYFSRIYVDDLVRIIRYAAERAPRGAVYAVGDDNPCQQGEYGRWLAAHLGQPEPPSADAHKSSARNAIRGRRLRNDRLKRELDLKLWYPTYREGELAIDAVEQGAPLPPLRLLGLASDQDRPAEAAPVAPAQAEQAAQTEPPAQAAAPAQSPAPAQVSAPAQAPQAPQAPQQAPQAQQAATPAVQPAPAPAPAQSPAQAPVQSQSTTQGPTQFSAAPTPPPAGANWPSAALGADLGTALGREELGVSLRELPPGESLSPAHTLAAKLAGAAEVSFVVLQGTPSATHRGQTVLLKARDLVPPGAVLKNDGPAPVLLLAIRAARR